MKIINAGYKILNKNLNGLQMLKDIEKVGRVCYKSEDLITKDGESAKKFVKMLTKNHHEAMLEHGGTISVLFTVDRGVTHELVRHRLASFAQESTRYCNYSHDKFGDEITVIKPYFFEKDSPEYKLWKDSCLQAEKAYFDLLKAGATPQEARLVLPTSVKADITVTANIREWRHILNLRAAGTTGKPHPQMCEVMVPLLNELHQKVPVVFDDITAVL